MDGQTSLLLCLHATKSGLDEAHIIFAKSCYKHAWTPWGVTLIFSYIRRLGSFLGVQNIEFHYSLDEYFLGYEDFVDILGEGGGHHKIGLYLGVISMHFRVFS